MPKKTNFIRSLFKDKLARRLSNYFITIAILSSVGLVVVASFVQYRLDIASINQDVKQAVATVEQQIINHLWIIDEDSLTLVLEGVNRLPAVSGIEVYDEFNTVFSFGQKTDEALIDKSLIRSDRVVGSIKVYANNQLALNELRSKLLYASLGAVFIFISLGFVFFIIVKRTITNHLSELSRITTSPEYYQHQEDFRVTLDRSARDDELSNLVNALNTGLDKSRELASTQRDYEAQLYKRTYVDDLTNIPNRRDADEHIGREINKVLSRKTPQNLMIVFIDLDGFKEVNDSLSHTVGDSVLLETSRRFKNVMDKYSGYIARFGGDEFVGCVDCESQVKGELIAQHLIDEVGKQYTVDNMTLTLSCSIGIVFCPQHASSSEDVIRKADAAMYRAKALGRNGFVVYDEAIMKNILFESNLKQRIKKSLSNKKSLEIYYQPLININKNTIIGFEALLRWHDEVLGEVSPEVFVPMAEKTGFIFDIDIMVFESATAQVEKWRKLFAEDYKVSINFSPTNFKNNRITHWLNNEIIPRNDLSWVEFEVTERLILEDEAFVRDSLTKIVGSGARLSLDDFGTGFSSLGYIKKFSKLLSKIKIDRLFVNQLMHSEADLALVKSIITMADSLGIEWLAEGVETKEQVEKLAGLGCQFAQGFYYGLPMRVSEVEAYIQRWNKKYH